MQKRALSALQPTNILHIGNLFGAILPMVEAQKEHETFLFVVDYHAITVPQEPENLRKNILFATAAYLAAGIDPQKTVIFQQSMVPAHTELGWILNNFTHMGELERMTQFKDKSQKFKKTGITVGLFDYPVLMAADILLYNTNVVPVGSDQKQHVELARDLAERFNKRFGDTFVVPDVQIRQFGARIMGLDNPTKKMSKSAASKKNYISLMDDEDTILKKIMSAKTDSEDRIEFDESHPGISNLMTIFSIVAKTSFDQIKIDYADKPYKAFKQDLAEALILYLKPLQAEIDGYLAHPEKLKQILKLGAEKASIIANKKLEEVKTVIGIS